MANISLGTKRRIETVAPVGAVIGDMGNKSGKKYDPKRYGMNKKYVGYQKAWGPANRFQVRTKEMEISAAKSAQVLQHRLKFKTVCTSTRERLSDPNKRQMDQAGFAGQTKYATLYGYVFKKEWDSYED